MNEPSDFCPDDEDWKVFESLPVIHVVCSEHNIAVHLQLTLDDTAVWMHDTDNTPLDPETDRPVFLHRKEN